MPDLYNRRMALSLSNTGILNYITVVWLSVCQTQVSSII